MRLRSPGTKSLDLFARGSYVKMIVCGAAKINAGDVVWIIDYVIRGGPEPRPLGAGDTNCDGNSRG